MNQIATSRTAVATTDIEQVESFMLDLPQVECPVVHHFGPGIYIREVHLKAGTLAIGHAQRFEHLNIVLSGAVAMIGDDGSIKTIRAPMIFTGKPGRKVGYVVEDTIWQNVYATDETDIDVLEATYLDKSETWSQHNDGAVKAEQQAREKDRQDFKLMAKQAGFPEEVIRRQSENTEDLISMPQGYNSKITVRPSNIEGLGIFLSYPAEKGEEIGPARIDGKRTPLGRYTNHSIKPNARFELKDNGDIYLITLDRISGCCGGDTGEEVTVDYRQALSLSGITVRGDV